MDITAVCRFTMEHAEDHAGVEMTRGSNEDGLTPSLENTPLELKREILSLLSFASIYILRLTSKKLCESISLEEVRRLGPNATAEDVREAEDLITLIFYQPKQDHIALLPCYTCLKILPKKAFGDSQRKTPRGLNGSKSEKRFCVACGWEHRRYGLSKLKHDGKDKLLCETCGGLLEADGSGARVPDCHGHFDWWETQRARKVKEEKVEREEWKERKKMEKERRRKTYGSDDEYHNEWLSPPTRKTIHTSGIMQASRMRPTILTDMID